MPVPSFCWRVALHGNGVDAELDDAMRSMVSLEQQLTELPHSLHQAISARANPGESDGVAAAQGGVIHLLRLVLHHAWVETHLQGVPCARSIMSLSGQTWTVTARKLPPDIARLHARSVCLAVQTRDAWLRLLCAVLAGSAHLMAAGLGSAALRPSYPPPGASYPSPRIQQRHIHHHDIDTFFLG